MKKYNSILILTAWCLLLAQAWLINRQETDRKLKTSPKEEKPSIRVLLTTSDFGSYDHPEVTGSCGGQAFSYTPESPELQSEALVLDGGGEGITLTSVSRQCGNPLYRGTLEIRRNGDSLNLINEVPLETYLESVVPSEMPSYFGREALKAQAVCARTYAWKHMEGEGVRGYEADVDDSVSYQVYGNIRPQTDTTEAVRETEGQILCRNGEPVDTYYFSTSAGVTSTDEIWGAEEAAPHLKSVECEFDSSSPWRRWEVTVPWGNPEERASLLAGESVSLTGLEICSKSQSGAVTGLSVYTDKGTYTVENEYKVREFLSPIGCTITEKDGTKAVGGRLLPSAYFSMEVQAGKQLVLTGGGYGHGVGMSQNAADRMAAEGYTCEEILSYFFCDTGLLTLGAGR